MPFVEDLAVFFDADNGFAVRAVWKRAGGDVVDRVLFDEETSEVFPGEATATLRQITYRSVGAFADLSEGETVEIDTVRYRVRPPRLKDDGALMTATLVRQS
ncbi:MAG: hypothetical protein FWC38_00740 [Proteobacteria bacterium]|nr:hypothetical protein [Pseudomonadota bacterium]MCL2306769.1 hypothetical protein [Pseudomonadota bacterium]